ncbi:MAG: hypothetical protein DRP32_05495 [Thermotogae bacterium]|uniref:hypothetical protein n=1 Tax=Kosmotoga sp. TaxID=1955248 RepID=UPI000F21266F|nr:hypothetical protein [Kosmotoga sp.]MBO8165697.1 hypothetical protein [Kosmotoga sp.]RKX49264.1 MAG: hypothetical protein DRP32_05495 [Thermotogota bacterium]
MLRVSSLVFIIGAICSYIPLFMGDSMLATIFFAAGVTISLFIWYVLAINRDAHYKELVKKGFFDDKDMRANKLFMKRRAIPYVIAYTFSFTALQLSSMGAMKVLIENAYVLSEISDTAKLMEVLGKEYMIYSAVFLVSLISTAFLFYKLIDIIYNDEVKMQLIVSKKKRIPALVPGPISIWTVVLFTLISYGVFSWYFRYKLMIVQVLYGRFREKLKEFEKSTQKEEDVKKQFLQNTESAEKLKERYSSLLENAQDVNKRKEVIAALFRDLGKLSTKDAGTILRDLFDKALLSESEYKKLFKLLF